MNTLQGKNILLGITGSIAAYKGADLTRRLREQGANVRVVMTRSATGFITPLTLQALSGQPVHTELMDLDAEAAMGHIELSRWADAIAIAPASADFIARQTAGRADDLLTAICLACQSRIVVAPAMNQHMWANPATQDNVSVLKDRGIQIVGPDQGSQACGDTGPGRMADPDRIVVSIGQLFESGLLSGKQILVSAGPTREPLDPVRYISNRSSGKMGFAIAEAAIEAGAAVTLVTGPVHLETPARVDRIRVETASQMYKVVLDKAASCDIFISAAAVADYRPGLNAVSKIKKGPDELQIKLVRTNDILSAVATLASAPFTVGFAAETDNLLDYARGKMQRKNLDMIVANQVGPSAGFDRDDNELDILWSNGHVHINKNSKKSLARDLVKIISGRIHADDTTENTG
ncbi:MAG TPA: bifunctional phosphopantothenoylcysteine decarboxylase/phosphopantothenate--cysteine ligase CoaBC [Gammaproteobacteria bacterium]|nr:bifunctional phosphopantothenoylcysteine decarboxylase/phosphopantothenate--cysteine ligase CoaBC [Gammaproteobacteria bacterium]